jgi:SHS2 domain-containing protein
VTGVQTCALPIWQKHAKGTEVKGISYSGLSIRHDANGFMVEILFDV